jgi:hypothetical protein
MVPDLIEPTKEIPGLCPFVLRNLHEMRQLILATHPIRVAYEDLGLSVPPGLSLVAAVPIKLFMNFSGYARNNSTAIFKRPGLDVTEQQ